MTAPALDARILPLRAEDITALAQLARNVCYRHYPSIISIEQIEYVMSKPLTAR
jgi:hypothetical protein